MPNSCSVCPWLVSLLVLSSHRTVTVSYLYHVISFPKKLPCTDWTTQSRVQVVWTHQMHTSAVFLTHHPKCTHLQSRCAPVSYGRPFVVSLASCRGVWALDLPGAADSQVGGLQWWWIICWGKWRPDYTGLCGAVLPSLKESESSHVRVYTCEDPSACLCTCVHTGAVLTPCQITRHRLKTVREREGSWRKTVVPYVSVWDKLCFHFVLFEISSCFPQLVSHTVNIII